MPLVGLILALSLALGLLVHADLVSDTSLGSGILQSRCPNENGCHLCAAFECYPAFPKGVRFIIHSLSHQGQVIGIKYNTTQCIQMHTYGIRLCTEFLNAATLFFKDKGNRTALLKNINLGIQFPASVFSPLWSIL